MYEERMEAVTSDANVKAALKAVKRNQGIPTVLDRFIQHLLLPVLGPIWEPRFSDRSYGFRPGRSAHDAVRQVRDYAVSGKSWVVDIDIEKFFDRVNHDILMRRVAEVIRDKRVLKLMGRYLRSGIMVEGVVMERAEGTPQGSPLSPLLAKIYLGIPWTRNWSSEATVSPVMPMTVMSTSAERRRRTG